ncbi:MAG: DUF58 domain-containing protein [Verrucomicrobiales bacterium]|nr:DUF58 domain-containing protein [Verrucomicrobiales bacterium]
MAGHRYLLPEDIRKLQTFEFAARAVVEGYLSGRHRSRSRGSSIEFHEYREYTPGDDLKLVDWRVFARSDRHFLRTFEQETNLECHIFLDSSASMGFSGSSPISKLEYGSFFAAALSYLVIRYGDRVSLQLFDDKIREFFPPGSTGSHLNLLLNTLERNEPGNETSLAEALLRSKPLLKRKGILVIISDFFDNPASIFQALNPYLHQGFRIHLFHLLTPGELDLEQRGLTSYVDLEDGSRLIAHPSALRQRYKEAIEDHISSLRQLSQRRSVDYSLHRTDSHFFQLFDKLVN